MNKLVDCPECLGTGETLFKGRWAKKCKCCNGNEVTEQDIADSFLHITLLEQ